MRACGEMPSDLRHRPQIVVDLDRRRLDVACALSMREHDDVARGRHSPATVGASSGTTAPSRSLGATFGVFGACGFERFHARLQRKPSRSALRDQDSAIVQAYCRIEINGEIGQAEGRPAQVLRLIAPLPFCPLAASGIRRARARRGVDVVAAGPAVCRVCCSRSRPGRCCSRNSGTRITARSPRSGRSWRWSRSPSASALQTAFAAFVHAVVAEYVSFIVLLFALYTVAGGILVTRADPRDARNV